MTLEYINKKVTIRDEDGQGIQLSLITKGAKICAHIKLLDCMVDIKDNGRTGFVEDAILTISHLPSLDVMYQMRDFLNKELPDPDL